MGHEIGHVLPHSITDAADVVSTVVLVSVSAGASARVAAEGLVARAEGSVARAALGRIKTIGHIIGRIEPRIDGLNAKQDLAEFHEADV